MKPEKLKAMQEERQQIHANRLYYNHAPIPDLMTEKKVAEEPVKEEKVVDTRPAKEINLEKLRKFAEQFVRKEKSKKARQVVIGRPRIYPKCEEPKRTQRPPAKYDNNKSLYGINYDEE